MSLIRKMQTNIEKQKKTYAKNDIKRQLHITLKIITLAIFYHFIPNYPSLSY